MSSLKPSFRIEAFTATLRRMKQKNNSLLITKNMPVGLNEFGAEFPGDDPIGIEDEIYYMLKKPNSEYGLRDGVFYSGDAYGSICAKRLYDDGLYNEGYNLTKSAKSLLSKNNFARPHEISLREINKHDRVNIMLISEMQRRNFYRKLFTPLPGNGLALVLVSGGIISLV